MTSNWPSPLPGPAWRTWRNAYDHLDATVFAGLPLDLYHVLRTLPAVVQAETRAAECARRGDVVATNASCNAWCRAWIAAVKAHEQERAA